MKDIPIFGKLKSLISGGYVTTSDQVYDAAQKTRQDAFNAGALERIAALEKGGTGTGSAGTDYIYHATDYGLSAANADNTSAMQSLVNIVNAAGGGTISIPAGTFVFKGEVTWKTGVNLQGSGEEATVLKMTDGTVTDTGGLICQNLFKGDYVNNIFMRDFSIDATAMTNNAKGMFMRYIVNAQFSFIKIEGTTLTSLGIDFLNHVYIHHITVINGGRNYGQNSSAMYGCSGIGIGNGKVEATWTNEDYVITDCICIGCKNNGIFVEDQMRWYESQMAAGYSQVIANNICRGCKNGISIQGGRYVSVTGNVCYGNTNGFYSEYYMENCMVSGNIFKGNANGINVTGSKQSKSNMISGNIVSGSSAYGIVLNSTATVSDMQISGNLCVGNAYGIKISGSTEGLILQGNNERGSTSAGIDISGTHTDAVVKGNTYFGSVAKSATFSGTTTFVEQFNN